MQAQVATYPACELTTRWPLLLQVEPETRRGYVERAEAGERLTAEEAATLGVPAAAGGVLVPADGCLSDAVIAALFPNRAAVVREIVKLGLEAVEEQETW